MVTLLKPYKNEAIERLRRLQANENAAPQISTDSFETVANTVVAETKKDYKVFSKANALLLTGVFIYVISGLIMLVGAFTDEGIILFGMNVSFIGAFIINTDWFKRFSEARSRKVKPNIPYTVVNFTLTVVELAVFIAYYVFDFH